MLRQLHTVCQVRRVFGAVIYLAQAGGSVHKVWLVVIRETRMKLGRRRAWVRSNRTGRTF